uniref:hypothetical protein n=1 Tax=Cupriavidus yeoncheonensis TaxID=1462994 RepID=UPI003F4907C4
MNLFFRLVLLSLFGIPTISCAGPLIVRVEKPDWYKLISGNKSWNVTLQGEIDSASPDRVANALRQIGNDGADVYISSPGGDLLAGMKIGRLLRQFGANTYVGGLVSDPSNSFAGRAGVKPVPGGCYSACTLAFLGGVYRFTVSGSEYGVHRFSREGGPREGDLDAAQIVSAAIGTFIRDMDVDPGLFNIITEQGRTGIRLLAKDELERLNVVNNGRGKPEWSIEAVEGGTYLRGVQDSMYGQGKATFFCNNHQLVYSSFYQAGADRAKEIAGGKWYDSVLVDGKAMPIPSSVRKASGGEVYSIFPLTTAQALAIASSTSVGHAMQLARDAPTFVGYRVDIPATSTKKVSTFIHNCVSEK